MSGCDLGHEHVHALGQFQREFVRPPVAGPDERQPLPVEPVGRGTVLDVRPSPVADGDAVLVVADAVVIAEIELVDLDLVAVAHRAGVERVRVPMGHHLHALDHVCDAISWRAAGWSMHAQRLPAPHPRREGVEVGQVRVVIHMEVGEEDVVDRLQRHRHRDDVTHAAGAEIKEEPFAVSQLDHDAGAGLGAGDRDRRAADEGDPHFVGADLLLARVVDVVTGKIGRRAVIGRERDPAARDAAVRVLCLDCGWCLVSRLRRRHGTRGESRGSSQTRRLQRIAATHRSLPSVNFITHDVFFA